MPKFICENCKRPWKPKEDEYYFYISSAGEVRQTPWKNYEDDVKMLAFGNVFRTRPEAEKAAREIKKLLQKLQQ